MQNFLSITVASLCAGPLYALAAGLSGLSAAPFPPAIPIAANPAPAAAPERVGNSSPSFAALAARCAPSIHIRTLSSLVRQESRVNPYAININGRHKLVRQPVNAAEAIATAQSLLDQGYNIDVGLGQINSNNFRALGLSLADLFEPCANLQAAAQVLANCYARGVAVSGEGQAALHAALSCYNTGSLSKGIRNGYVRRVLAQAHFPVPELIPLASRKSVREPAPLRANRAGASVRQDAATPVSTRPKTSSGERDVFTASADADAFSTQSEKEGEYRYQSKLNF